MAEAQPLSSSRRSDAAAGIVLIAAGLLGLLLANSPLAPLYDGFRDFPLSVQAGQFSVAKPLLSWVNDGLMAIFFLLAALEIKRELIAGALASWTRAVLPLGAALGGMAVPALVFFAFNARSGTLAGWAIPIATDVAFALGILALAGPRLPSSLKILLTAIAVVDDLGAILVIALFYAGDLSWLALLVALLATLGMVVCNFAGITRTWPYILLGVVAWLATLKSGVHATVAGVATGFAIPYRGSDDGRMSPLERFEHALEPFVAFVVLPLFAFVNAGVSLSGMGPGALADPVSLGVLLGLIAGKPAGVFAAIRLLVGLGVARPPEGASWRQIYGISVLAGIGFTMSLFISELAFGPERQSEIRTAVLAASALAGLYGYCVLRGSIARSR